MYETIDELYTAADKSAEDFARDFPDETPAVNTIAGLVGVLCTDLGHAKLQILDLQDKCNVLVRAVVKLIDRADPEFIQSLEPEVLMDLIIDLGMTEVK
jgi:hypothetical protein